MVMYVNTSVHALHIRGAIFTDDVNCLLTCQAHAACRKAGQTIMSTAQ